MTILVKVEERSVAGGDHARISFNRGANGPMDVEHAGHWSGWTILRSDADWLTAGDSRKLADLAAGLRYGYFNCCKMKQNYLHYSY